MNKAEHIIFEWSGSEIPNYNNLIHSIEKSLSQFPKTIRKKIILCSIELVQNILLHNDEPDILINISNNNREIVLTVANTTTNKKAGHIITHFNNVNKLNLKELKDLYILNLQKKHKTDDFSVGNGIILCLLKSKKNMEISVNPISDLKKQVLINMYFDYEKDN